MAVSLVGDSLLEILPENIVLYAIMSKFDLKTLCPTACVSRTLHSSVDKALLSVSSLDLSAVHSSRPCILNLSLQTVCTIANCLPLLVVLDLIDVPITKPYCPDLSDQGVCSLVACTHLTSLSLVKSRQNVETSFIKITENGMFQLFGACKGLESLRLGGFSNVSNAGFTSILDSCFNLNKFEIQYASCLTDMAFHNFNRAPRAPLVDLKLMSCSSITGKGVCELVTASSSLEILDLHGCTRVADSCLRNISCLTLLTSLNLGGTDVTDAGMAVLAQLNAPLSHLSLRSCCRVTDKGIAYLLGTEGKIRNTLSSLDLGCMPVISDKAITTVSDACVGLIELCIRYCYQLTDAAIKALASMGRLKDEMKLLRRLDLCNCIAFSVESFKIMEKPLFCGLQWIGIGSTRLLDADLAEMYKERPWMTICKDDCEIGCR